MSVTELQVIQKRTTRSMTSSRFLLPNDGDQDDAGLVMKIDSKPKEVQGTSQPNSPCSISGKGLPPMKNASAVRPSAVSSQLCGQSQEVTGWILRGALFVQTAHIPFIKLTHKMNDTVQRKMKLLMPIFFYMSLLVLVAQAGAVVMLFSQSFMPIGMWFLLCCIAILAGMFCYTAIHSDSTRANSHSKLKL